MDKFKLVARYDGTYDIIINYNDVDTEFALDFLTRDIIKNKYAALNDFIAKKAKSIKISSVKIMVAGMIIATIQMSFFQNNLTAAQTINNAKFSMTYLYGGTVQDQINYVERTNNSLQTVSPSYFDINPDGTLKLNTVSKELVDKMHAKNIKVVPFLSNHWDRNAGINALNDVHTLSNQIADYIIKYNLDGVNVDIENVTQLQRSQYTEFVRLLREKIPSQKEVSVAVAANPKNWQTGWQGSYDYTELGKNADYLMIMTYDEHYEGSNAGPVASIGFVRDSIKYALSKTTADKIVIGLPFFGRIWSVGNNDVMGKGLGIQTIDNLISTYNATVTFDEVAQSPKAEFEVKSGDKQFMVGGKALTPGNYVIWYENDQSLQKKLSLVKEYNLKGAGSWALGKENVSIWQNYNTWLNGEEAQSTEIQTGIENSASSNTPVTAKTELTTVEVPANQTLIGSGKITLKAPSDTTIYYTIDGTSPTVSTKNKIVGGTSKSLTISKTTTVKAIAVKKGYTESNVVTRKYTVKTAQLSSYYIPNNKTIIESGKVTLKAPDNTIIYYTTDGSTPTTSSPKIEAGKSKTITVSKTTTVKSRVLKTGCSISDVITRKYTVQTAPLTTANLPLNKSFYGSSKIKLNAPSNATLYYTTDGSVPTTKSAKVIARSSKIITINKTTSIKAIAVRPGCSATSVITRKYTKI